MLPRLYSFTRVEKVGNLILNKPPNVANHFGLSMTQHQIDLIVFYFVFAFRTADD